MIVLEIAIAFMLCVMFRTINERENNKGDKDNE